MANIPAVGRQVNVFVGGIGFVGKTEEYKLPDIKTTKVDGPNGVPVDTGILEKLEAEVTLNTLSDVIFTELSKLQNAQITLKSALSEGGVSKNSRASITGSIDIERDPFKPKETAKVKIKIHILTYQEEIDGKEVVNIDLPNNIAIVGGKDLYEEVRNAIS